MQYLADLGHTLTLFIVSPYQKTKLRDVDDSMHGTCRYLYGMELVDMVITRFLLFVSFTFEVSDVFQFSNESID